MQGSAHLFPACVPSWGEDRLILSGELSEGLLLYLIHKLLLVSGVKDQKEKHFTLFCILGTCINNTSVMMFKKGSFEIGATVYPVAIKVGALRGPVVITAAAAEDGRLQPVLQSLWGSADLPMRSSLLINPTARRARHLKGASCGAGMPGASVRLPGGAGGWAQDVCPCHWRRKRCLCFGSRGRSGKQSDLSSCPVCPTCRSLNL